MGYLNYSSHIVLPSVICQSVLYSSAKFKNYEF